MSQTTVTKSSVFGLHYREIIFSVFGALTKLHRYGKKDHHDFHFRFHKRCDVSDEILFGFGFNYQTDQRSFQSILTTLGILTLSDG